MCLPISGTSTNSGTIYDDNGTDNSGKHYLLRWEIQGDGETLHLRLRGAGDYHPAWLENIRVQLPAGEQRELVIEGNITVKSDE